MDEAGGSGVASITYSSRGANSVAETTAAHARPCDVTVSFPAPGSSTLRSYATNLADNQKSDQALTIVTHAAPAPTPDVSGAATTGTTVAAGTSDG